MKIKKYLLMALLVNVANAQQQYNCDSACLLSSNINVSAMNKGHVISSETFFPGAPPDKSSKPESKTLSCNAYQGQFDIPIGANGTFILTREGNLNNPNYGKALSYNITDCTEKYGKWTWLGWNGGGTAKECIYNKELVNKGMCNPIGTTCLFKDDMTTKKGQFQCQ